MRELKHGVLVSRRVSWVSVYVILWLAWERGKSLSNFGMWFVLSSFRRCDAAILKVVEAL